MAYSLKIHTDRVIKYLRDFEALSRQGRIQLFAHLHSDLRANGDYYLNDENRRVALGSSCFRHEIIVEDQEGDGRIRRPTRCLWSSISGIRRD